MPKGLKQTSSPIQISSAIQLSANPSATQFLSKRVDLQLNPLDNEVFVVTGVKIDFSNPIAEIDLSTPGAKDVTQRLSVSTTEQTSYAGIDSPSVIAASAIDGVAQILAGEYTVYAIHEQNAMDAPPASMDYLQIIATNDFHLNYFVGEDYNAGVVLRANVRLYGYRAVADASTYAALVQSELLSA